MTDGLPMGFGNGPSTPNKLARVAKIVPWVIRMSATHLARSGGRFYLFDANGGPGRYEGPAGETLFGSPVLALRALRELDVPYRAVIIERDAAIYRALVGVLDELGLHDHRWVQVVHGDNRDILPHACQMPALGRDRGLLFLDPRGALDFASVEPVLALPRMGNVDVLANLCTNILKQERNAARSARWQGKGKWATKDVRPLYARLPLLHKARWLIGEPTTDPLAWSLLLGSNWKGFPEWRAGEMDAWDGTGLGPDVPPHVEPVGNERLRRISLTKKECRWPW